MLKELAQGLACVGGEARDFNPETGGHDALSFNTQILGVWIS